MCHGSIGCGCHLLGNYLQNNQNNLYNHCFGQAMQGQGYQGQAGQTIDVALKMQKEREKMQKEMADAWIKKIQQERNEVGLASDLAEVEILKCILGNKTHEQVEDEMCDKCAKAKFKFAGPEADVVELEGADSENLPWILLLARITKADPRDIRRQFKDISEQIAEHIEPEEM